MARTYWASRVDGALEFLGAFGDTHTVKDKTQPQAGAVIIDIVDRDIEGVISGLDNRVLLVALPSAIRKRLNEKVGAAIQWAQIEGFIK
jgi:hypothetical protein